MTLLCAPTWSARNAVAADRTGHSPGPATTSSPSTSRRTWKVGGTTAAVIDAKYKAEKPAGYPSADLNQLLAYCAILGLPVGHLVYARGNASPARHVVRQSGIKILCHAIDLSQPPEQLLEQMSELAEVVTALTSSSPQTS